ncbi:MAG: ABC transporter permease, partial [Rhizobacter sp.]
MPSASTAPLAQPATEVRRAWSLPRWWLGAVVPVSAILLLEVASRAGWIAANLLPPPSEVLNTLWWLVQQGGLLAHVGASSLRVLTGFAAGAGLAL